MNPRILSHCQRIDNLFSRVASFDDPKDKSEWSKYLCILVSGYIEESLRVLLEDYASERKNASSPIKNFVLKQIKNITNCKTQKILDTLDSFDSSWKDAFEEKITPEIKDSIDSIVANRHAIAHGKNTGITYTTVTNYYKNIKKAIEILEDIIQ